MVLGVGMLDPLLRVDRIPDSVIVNELTKDDGRGALNEGMKQRYTTVFSPGNLTKMAPIESIINLL